MHMGGAECSGHDYRKDDAFDWACVYVSKARMDCQAISVGDVEVQVLLTPTEAMANQRVSIRWIARRYNSFQRCVA